MLEFLIIGSSFTDLNVWLWHFAEKDITKYSITVLVRHAHHFRNISDLFNAELLARATEKRYDRA